jgi:hypothetical protein
MVCVFCCPSKDARLLKYTGIALLIAAISQRNELDLYHYHVVYDTVSFTG